MSSSWSGDDNLTRRINGEEETTTSTAAFMYQVSRTEGQGQLYRHALLMSEQVLMVAQCDRTKPCSACCARGHRKECEFTVCEGNDYTPIQQSYEIRKLRSENQKLKQRLRNARLLYSGDEIDGDELPDGTASRVSSRATAAKQRRFRTSDHIDNIYFGTPGLASMVSDVSDGFGRHHQWK
ncbi:hypothetical protein LTR95_015303 [Oleoguttula sp. CCFEE 5521]